MYAFERWWPLGNTSLRRCAWFIKCINDINEIQMIYKMYKCINESIGPIHSWGFNCIISVRNSKNKMLTFKRLSYTFLVYPSTPVGRVGEERNESCILKSQS